MRPMTLWNETLMLTMACGSPGSAWAYHHIEDRGASGDGPKMVHRTIESPDAVAKPQRPALAGAAGWIGKLWRRLEQWSWEQQVRRDEAYLAQAQNLADLETRMRRLDGDLYARARTLR